MRLNSLLAQRKKKTNRDAEIRNHGENAEANNAAQAPFPSKPELTIAERVKLLLKLLTICTSFNRIGILPLRIRVANRDAPKPLVPARLAANVLRMLVLSVYHRMNIRWGLLSALVRTVFGTLTAKEIQTIQPTTRQEYGRFIKYAAKRWSAPNFKNRIVYDLQELNKGVDDSAIMWLGDRKKAKKIVLFLHGGGYVLPASDGHFLWAWNAYVLSGVEAGVETAVAMLQYTLAPRGLLTTPLTQAVSAYEEIRAQGFQPSDIIVGGDSAGGNLTMQFLGHSLHAQPGVPEIKLSEPFAGSFLVSAYVGRRHDLESFTAYHSNDMVSTPIIENLVKQTMTAEDFEINKTKQNPWVHPLEADLGWFQDLDTVVRKLYITWGGREVMGSQSVALVEVFKREAPGVDLVDWESPKSLHDAVLLEGIFKNPGINTRKMKTWFKSVIIQ